MCVCVPALTASGVTTATSILTPERREAVVCVCACINSKWCNNSNIHPDSGKTRGSGVCVPALTASGVTTATSILTPERREAVVCVCACINSKWCNNSNIHRCIEDLCGCFECTDSGVFLESCDNLTELNDHVTRYIKFCEGLICPEKIIKCYPNNKPWITKEVKDIITRKRVTFSSGDKAKLKSLQKELRDGIRKCRVKYTKC